MSSASGRWRNARPARRHQDLEALRRETVKFRYYRGEEEPLFNHPVELEYAKILESMEMPWLYEPRTFVLECDENGTPISSFTPDFYLPELDLYVETTVCRTRNGNRKNRKARLLRELYPDVKIIVLKRRNFARLAEKYGFSLDLLDWRLDDRAEPEVSAPRARRKRRSSPRATLA